MANKNIVVQITGKDSLRGVLSSAGSGIRRLAQDATTSNNKIAGSSRTAQQAISKIGTTANTTSTPLRRLGQSGQTAGNLITRGITSASGSIGALTSKINGAIGGFRQLGSAGKGAGKEISSGMNSATGSLDELSGLIGGVIGGFGALQIAQSAWTGATQKQYYNMWLGTKMGKDEAAKYQKEIQKIVEAVPGDDTFMYSLLSGALAKQTSLTTDQLRLLGDASAKYIMVSQQEMGGFPAEYQREVRDYILTGNTGLMARDGLLRNELDHLEGKGTVEERILALNEALNDAGYEGLDISTLTAARWEMVKGKFQAAATVFGEKVLPYIDRALQWFLEMDETTGGLSTQMILIAGGVIAVGAALGPVLWAFKQVYGTVKDIGGGIKDMVGRVKDFILPSKKKVEIDCEQDDDCKVRCDDDSDGGILPPSKSRGKSRGKKPSRLQTAWDFVKTTASTTWAKALGLGGLITGISATGFTMPNIMIDPRNLPLIGGLFKGTAFGEPGGGTGVVYAAEPGKKKPSIKEDIWGKGGLLRGTPLEGGIKWPSTGQILKSIKDKLPKMPTIKWPTVGSIGSWIRSKIPRLNWKWPNIGSIGSWIRSKIPRLNWKWPNIGSIGSWIQSKIPRLSWKPPSTGSILEAIKSRITNFRWPWGPGNVARRVPSRGTAQPAGILSDAVANRMASLAGVDSNWVRGAMARGFSGKSAFRQIAEAMAGHLSYQLYLGNPKSDAEVWRSGRCNCMDGAELLLNEASKYFGLGGSMPRGFWGGWPHRWANIAGTNFDMAAKLIRGSWNPPAGPLESSMTQFEMFMSELGPALSYEGYGGTKYDPISALLYGGNCFDMTLGLMGIAQSLFGLPARMMWGTYDGYTHVWANIGGRNWDLTRKVLENTYTPPPRGPAPTESGGVTFGKGSIVINGDINGIDDFEKKIERVAYRAMEKAAGRAGYR